MQVAGSKPRGRPKLAANTDLRNLSLTK